MSNSQDPFPKVLSFIHHLIKLSHLHQSLIRSQVHDSISIPSSKSSTLNMSSSSDEDQQSATATETLLTPQQSIAQQAISHTLATTAKLVNLLPIGSLLAFQLLTPIITNNGSCNSVTGPMTFILIAILAFSCFIACFTDRFKSSQGIAHYGFITRKGLKLIDNPSNDDSDFQVLDLRQYKLRVMDVAHVVLCVFVLIVVAFRDKNVLICFYPETRKVLSIDVVGVGMICVLMFVVFPTTRRGNGLASLLHSREA